MKIDIPAHEHGVVRVFSLSMTAEEAGTLQNNEPGPDGATPASVALGLSDINAEFVEAFPVSQTGELGLAGYLEQGNGIDPTLLEPDLARLRALDGWVLIVYSRAFGDQAVTLSPAPELTLIATYNEPGADWSATQTLTSASAEGTVAPARKKPSDAAMSGRVATLALLVLFAVTALMVWVGG